MSRTLYICTRVFAWYFFKSTGFPEDTRSRIRFLLFFFVDLFIPDMIIVLFYSRSTALCYCLLHYYCIAGVVLLSLYFFCCYCATVCCCCCCTYCCCFRGSAASFSSLSDTFQLALHGIGTAVDSRSLDQLYTTTPNHFHPLLDAPPCNTTLQICACNTC